MIFKVSNLENKGKEKSWTALLLFSSSTIALVFCTRTFSNTTEAIFFSILFYFCLTTHKSEQREFPKIKYILIGVILSLAFFIRFTSLVFCFFPGLFFLYHSFLQRKSFPSWAFSLLWVSIPALLTASLFILVDTFYFEKCGTLFSFNGVPITFSQLVSLFFNHFTRMDLLLSFLCGLKLNMEAFQVTPVNNLFYNLNPSNLALHGTHNRVTHALINAPLLFGPLLVFLHPFSKRKSSHILSTLTFFFSLFLLSTAPHQEPRFLLPLSAPLLLSSRFSSLTKSPQSLFFFFSLHLFFHFSLSLFFSFFHQAGVLPSLLSLCQITSNHTFSTAIFSNTYIPPHFLFASCSHKVKLIDFAGSQLDSLSKQIAQSQLLGPVLLFLPGSVTSLLSSCVSNCNMTLLSSFSPHLSTENFPRSLSELSLNVFNITCSK